MKSSRNCNIAVFSCGLILIGLGVALRICFPSFFTTLYEDDLKLAPSSTSFKLWKHTPLPLYLEVYLFNWTNAEEFIADKSVVPHFDEVGPFVFQEVHDRVNLSWNNNNTLSYYQTRKWTYVPEQSLDLSMEITNLNVIAATASHLLKDIIKFKNEINFGFKKLEKFVVTSPAKNWLFEGIDDKLLNYLSVIEEILHLQITPRKFGWFHERNMSATYDGHFTINTGADNVYNVGLMDKWNGVSQTKYYSGQCGLVKGSSGELFPPMLSMEDNITVFISDMCSSITLNANGKSFVEGIESYTYVGDEMTFDNGEFDPDNDCFCNKECIPYGVRDVSACRKAPLFFSFPHFYMANESYRNSISGMMPNKSEHEFVIQLDPVTGIPTNIRAQFQINILIEPISWLTMFKNVPKIYVPMMWFRERATITKELALKALLIKMVPIVNVALFSGLIGIGVLMVGIRLFVLWRRSRSSDDDELLIPPVMDYDDDRNLVNDQDNSRNPVNGRNDDGH